MGVGVILHGYIDCPGYAHIAEVKRVYRFNRRVILGLPISDTEHPYITRDMFSMLPLRPSLDRRVAQYENQIIHFAGDYKNMYQIEADWLRKFENLLSRLCWYRAVVMIEISGLGYEWRVSLDQVREGYRTDPPRPPTRWSFRCYEFDPKVIPPSEAIDGTFDSPYHTAGEGGA